jgi:GNAT superfamily N-acetyltransferase
VKNLNVIMVRDTMDDIPAYPFPKGFNIRRYRQGEGNIWTRIQRAAEPFGEINDDLFQCEFGRDIDSLEDRSFFLITELGNEIGTITSWWQPNWKNSEWGQIHWVAIHPDFHGRGLAKPMMSVAMKRLQQSHIRSFLRTSTGRIAAIKVYLDFGFLPDMDAENSQEAWQEVASHIKHPSLIQSKGSMSQA